MPGKTRKPPTEPTEATLNEAALAHLARYGTSAAGLTRVLDRRVARWAASSGGDSGIAAAARAAARRIVARLIESGAVSDTAFAQSRVRSLSYAGKSARAIGAHLAAKGVPRTVASPLLPAGAESELAAAAMHIRRRRLGAFRVADATPETARKELAALARAGFAQPVAREALQLARDEAERLILERRADL